MIMVAIGGVRAIGPRILWLLLLLVVVLPFPSLLFLDKSSHHNHVHAFVLLPGKVYRSPRHVLFSTRTTRTTTTTSNLTTTTTIDDGNNNNDDEDLYQMLFQNDPTIDLPLPPAYTECPFNGIVSGPQSFYRMAHAALNNNKNNNNPPPTTSVFSFVHSSNKKNTETASQKQQQKQQHKQEQQHSQPMVEVSGGRTIRKLLAQEFQTLTSNAVAGISQLVCGSQSLRTIDNAKEHTTLRQLIGVPLSTSAVANSIPQLESIARKRIQNMLFFSSLNDKNNNNNKDDMNNNKNDDNDNSSSSSFVLIARELTQGMALDVTSQLILGLNHLKDEEKEEGEKDTTITTTKAEEIAKFEQMTATWLKGIYNKPGTPEMDATLQARSYLVQAIENKIQDLEYVGKSDGSTIGGLLFATTIQDDTDDNNDDNNDVDPLLVVSRTIPSNQRTLSREEIIHNALLLILGGTETVTGTLANALLLMGLHPHVWESVVQEQEKIVAEYGESLSSSSLHESTYLDAVIQETMRILPITLISRRLTKETMIVNGRGTGKKKNNEKIHSEDQQYQIPKGWGIGYNIYLTHENDPVMEKGNMDLELGFRPERWLSSSSCFVQEEENSSSSTTNNNNKKVVTTTTLPRPSAMDYLPFGSGPRQCPGGVLALTEMKVFLSLLARAMPHYELVQQFDRQQQHHDDDQQQTAGHDDDNNKNENDNNSSSSTVLLSSSSSSLSIEEQIQWENISAVLTPADGIPIRVLSKTTIL